MYKAHYLFEELPDSTIIWKYLDFDKFLSLLVTQSLYFCRSDKFEDPYEGTLTQETMQQLRETIDSFGFNNSEEMFHQMLMLLNTSRKMTLVNCWHMNEFESDGMWKLYSKVKNAIAIQTTVGKLKSAFASVDQDVFIGKVRYIDFDKTFIEGFTMLGPFVYKRQSFAHEQELRAVVWETGTKHVRELLNEEYKEGQSIPIQFVDHGKSLPVDIAQLVEKVYFSPLSEGWFVSLVADIIAKYGYDFEMVTSSLLSIPEYLAKKDAGDANADAIQMPLEVLKAFIEKDSFRLQREEDDRLRTIGLQTESIKNKLRLIETRIGEIGFDLDHGRVTGAAAIAAIGKQFAAEITINYDLLLAPETNLFMLVGSFDTLIVEITSSIIPQREKDILVAEACFLFTEKCMAGLPLIALRIVNEEQIGEGYAAALDAFCLTIFKIMKEIEDRKI